jgi:glycosyltransferase involved in cell wall biosynthesis
MKFSIVTISYNQGIFLEAAIRSILSQDYKDIEYIVVDAGSTDGSREIIERYRKQINKIICQPDNGPADGLNNGFQYASGEVFGYLNADDMLLPNAVSQVASAFHKRSDTSVISGHGIVTNADGLDCRRIYSHRFDLRAYAYGACILVQPSTFFRKDPFIKVGGFNTLNRFSWDGELWVDLALQGEKFSRIHSYLAKFRVHGNSVTGSGNYQTEIQEQHDRICRKIGINPRSIFERRLIWMLNRLSDPIATSARLFDVFTNRPLYENLKKDPDAHLLIPDTDQFQ